MVIAGSLTIFRIVMVGSLPEAYSFLFLLLLNRVLPKATSTDVQMLWKIKERMISPMVATFFLVLLNDEQSSYFNWRKAVFTPHLR